MPDLLLQNCAEAMCMQSVKFALQQAEKLTILGGCCRLLGLGYAGHEHVVPRAGRAKALRPERGRHRGRRRVLGELQLRLRAAEQDVGPREGPACKPTGLILHHYTDRGRYQNHEIKALHTNLCTSAVWMQVVKLVGCQ